MARSGFEVPGEAFDTGAALHSFAQEIEQGQFKRTVGCERVAGDPKPLTSGPQIRAMGFELSEVLFAGCIRVNEKRAARFEVLKHR